MLTIRTLLMLAVASASLAVDSRASGQITLTAASNTPGNGLVARNLIGTYLNPVPSGANQVWDFTGTAFTVSDSFTIIYYDRPSLGTCGQFAGANLISTTPQQTITDTNYFATTSNGIERVGTKTTRRDVYSNTRTVMKFPLMFAVRTRIPSGSASITEPACFTPRSAGTP